MRSDAAAPERRVNLDRSPNGRRRCLCCTEQMVELLESLARVVRQSRALGQVLVGMFFLRRFRSRRASQFSDAISSP